MNAVDSIVAEARQNPRLQFGLVAIAAIVGLYLLLLWGDAVDADRRRLEQAHADLRLASSSEAVRQRWLDTAERAATMAAALNKSLWTAPTLAHAQAQIQDWAEGILAGAGVRGASIAFGADTAERREVAGATPVRLNIAFDGAPYALDRILPLLESGERMTRITSLRAVRGQPRIEIVLLAYARIDAAPGAGGATGQR